MRRIGRPQPKHPDPKHACQHCGLRVGGPEGAYLFATADGQRTVALTRDFVAVTERDYSRWENFRAETDRIKSALERIYQPSFYTRVGLRYQDLVDPRELGLDGVPWAELRGGGRGDGM